jgi:hypothetical protein
MAAVAVVAAMVGRGRSDADDGGKDQGWNEKLTHCLAPWVGRELLRLGYCFEAEWSRQQPFSLEAVFLNETTPPGSH